MEHLLTELDRQYDARPILGYLNFSDGRPDPKFRKAFAEGFGILLTAGDRAPWATLATWLRQQVTRWEQSDSAAFRDLTRARELLDTAFTAIPAAYRRHHVDLLAHQPDSLLFNSFFLARCAEVALAESTGSRDGLVDRAVTLLNDYVGYRPIAVLETRPQTDYYPHEKVAAVPLFIRGVGVAPGRYAEVLRPALDLLGKIDGQLLRQASFDSEKMDELALDPRAVDHFHPVSKRPSMLFGEWDPHRIDGSGYYRRFVLRQPTLDALVRWSQGEPDGRPGDPERLFEAAAVLAGTVLMGAGMCGAGPTSYDSTVTLANLVTRIARYRDEFYQKLLQGLSGTHGVRLRQEAEKRKQPFAGVRQFLNAAIASERALHLQERRLSMFYAAMGYPAAARDRAHRISAPSVRLGTEIRMRQTEAGFVTKAGPARSAQLLAEAEDLLQRGIECGALIDPWNILGYQGLFPTFPGREDSVRDPRAEELILTIGRQFDAYAQCLSAAATSDDRTVQDRIQNAMMELAQWWDRFATMTVTDLPRVNGAERAEAAEHVARALALWRNAGSADPGFWRKHRDAFTTPSAYAQVIDALLDQPDYKAALGLLVTWLDDADNVPLQDSSASFFRLTFRWLRGVTASTTIPPTDQPSLIRRFFELLEVNADVNWHVPELGQTHQTSAPQTHDDALESEEEHQSEFASAYEEMTFRDSADDGTEGSVADGDRRETFGEFPLDADADATEDRLRFLATVARLWRMAAQPELWSLSDTQSAAALSEWLKTARNNLSQLQTLAEWLHAVKVPDPTGGLEGVMEFDRRRAVKGHLLDLVTQTAVEMTAAARSLSAVLVPSAELPPGTAAGAPRKTHATPPPAEPQAVGPTAALAPWEGVAIRLERAVATGDSATARKLLPGFITLFQHEPLLVSPPTDGGTPLLAMRAQTALQMLESLLTRLPRLGLLRETFTLTRIARSMERNSPPEGRRVSSFDQLFRTAVLGVVDAILESARHWAEDTDEDSPLASALRQVAESFHALWLEHSHSLRLSALEAVLDKPDWDRLRDFIRKYGGDLFTVRFLTLSNIRGILAQGCAHWLDREAEQADAEDRLPLVADWDAGKLRKPETVRQLETILHAMVEHYDEYRDYNTTTTQSDYGENLYILLDFLRLKVTYDRYAWRLRPMNLTHELLCRRGFHRLAGKWREFIASKTGKLTEELLGELSAREAEHGIRLRTIRDRLEERFVQPLRIDQASARVAWAAVAAREGQDEANPAFQGLAAAIQPLADHPSGVGLDVPAWLRRLEDELRRTRQGNAESDSELTEQFPFPTTRTIAFEELKRQLRDWEKPIEG